MLDLDVLPLGFGRDEGCLLLRPLSRRTRQGGARIDQTLQKLDCDLPCGLGLAPQLRVSRTKNVALCIPIQMSCSKWLLYHRAAKQRTRDENPMITRLQAANEADRTSTWVWQYRFLGVLSQIAHRTSVTDVIPTRPLFP